MSHIDIHLPNPLTFISELTCLYSEPHRYYHNIQHIHQLIRLLHADDLKQMLYYPDKHDNIDFKAVEYMIWFHDCYYDPYAHAGFNEHMSSTIFKQKLIDRKLNDGVFNLTPRQRRIFLAISASANYLKYDPTYDFSTALFLDLDLYGFSDTVNYDINTQNIRKEYRNTSDIEFNQKRLLFLNKLLERERLYYTFNNQIEVTARSNIKKEISKLETQ